MIGNFSARDLTKETDRLVAVQGPVETMAKTLGLRGVPGARCFAGLWQADVSRQLLWRAVDSEMRVVPPCDCPEQRGIPNFIVNRPRWQRRGPNPLFSSWSWAQMNQMVRYLSVTMEIELIRLHENNLLEASHEELSGSVTVDGVLKTVLVVPGNLSLGVLKQQ